LIEEYWLWDCCKEMPCACGGDLCHSYSSIVYPVVGIFLIGLLISFFSPLWVGCLTGCCRAKQKYFLILIIAIFIALSLFYLFG